jgi:imidazole glycerol-phosphate synthase subunit HisH
MLAVVDYGMGNLGSIVNTLRRIGVASMVTSSPDDLQQADQIILPGVGSFDRGMENLRQLGLIPILEQRVLEEHVPILGICLGMQLFCEGSEEGASEGLGWIESSTRRFRFSQNGIRLKIPHMGWNAIQTTDETLLSGINGQDRFYFVHSYHIGDIPDEQVIGTTTYCYDFPSVIRRGNIMGIQCHPERSHQSGLRFLRNFTDLI